MRVFSSADGRRWNARIYDGPQDDRVRAMSVGWEVILFEADGADLPQRIAYRPVGWLGAASDEDLAISLGQAETVRARWGEPQQAGG